MDKTNFGKLCKLTHHLCADNKLIFAAAAPKTAVTWIFSHVCDLKGS